LAALHLTKRKRTQIHGRVPPGYASDFVPTPRPGPTDARRDVLNLGRGSVFMHPLTVSAAFLALSSAFLLYGLSYDTRQLEARVAAQERDVDGARADIAVLKAERAHLARPSRIAPLARSQGLEPLSERQFSTGTDGDIQTGAIS